MLVECPNCSAIVDGEWIADYVDTDEPSGTSGKFTFLRCPRCARPFLMLQTDDGPGWDDPSRLYPPIEMAVSAAIPGPLRAAYEEARTCFRAKAYTATAIMCRKTLEGIAETNEISARNLAGALKEMRERGIIESRLYEWADTLRMSGNEAAHGVNMKLSAQDAKDILEFTHALLEYVYSFQEKFDQFKARRAANQAPP